MPEPLHWVGLTYLERDFSYWWRRVALTLFWFFLTALSGGMAVGFSYGMAQVNTAALIAFVSVYGLLSATLGCTTAVKIRRVDRLGVTVASHEARKSRFHAWEQKADALLSSCAPVVFIAVPIAFGAALPHFIRSFGRYTIGERVERQKSGLDA
ncbi:hypothetical protein [Streptomyces caatingaensis]|uniref:Uncharacterized protein n=1 Tax=Streptomyces caatingaensis TaxID=1678637 RepID=A0A0K9XHX2_9ACTN|nr:hypothetical protein [Streptomyces caatingaensis]KNB52985.1 hypothetical protein AC230_10300 [Streptomyces caatingaensis]